MDNYKEPDQEKLNEISPEPEKGELVDKPIPEYVQDVREDMILGLSEYTLQYPTDDSLRYIRRKIKKLKAAKSRSELDYLDKIRLEFLKEDKENLQHEILRQQIKQWGQLQRDVEPKGQHASNEQKKSNDRGKHKKKDEIIPEDHLYKSAHELFQYNKEDCLSSRDPRFPNEWMKKMLSGEHEDSQYELYGYKRGDKNKGNPIPLKSGKIRELLGENNEKWKYEGKYKG